MDGGGAAVHEKQASGAELASARDGRARPVTRAVRLAPRTCRRLGGRYLGTGLAEGAALAGQGWPLQGA